MDKIEDNESYGTVVVGSGSAQEKELKVINFVQSRYLDNRLVSISELEDNTFVLIVENPSSTGRNPQSIMRLSKESFIGLMTASNLYWMCKGENMDTLIKDSLNSNESKIEYSYSKNLKPHDF